MQILLIIFNEFIQSIPNSNSELAVVNKYNYNFIQT